MPLDDDKLEAIRRWGEQLRHASGDRQAAAGRAILMLVEEIDGLRNELSRAHWQLREAAPPPSDEPEDAEQPAASLNERLHRVLRRESDSSSPESWIESLRREK